MSPSDDLTPPKDQPPDQKQDKPLGIKNPHGQVNILPLPKTRMNRFQHEKGFAEGDFTPIAPDELKRRRKARVSGERFRQRQKMVIHKRRVQKRRRVFLKRLKYIANVAAFFILGITIWVLIANPLWRFDGQNFQLKSASLLTEKHIKSIINQYANIPIYHINPQTIAEDIKRHFPIVDELYVRRSVFPSRLEITILEKVPFAEIYTSPEAIAPVNLATFEGSRHHYGAVPLALYAYKPGQYKQDDSKTGTQKPLPHLIVPPGTKLSQGNWQRLDHLLLQASQINRLPLKAVQLVPLPVEVTQNKSGKIKPEEIKADQFPYSLIIHYPDLMVFVGTLDAELNQRVSRLSLLSEKIMEFRAGIRAVDLRWSDQITFIKKGAPLPLASPPLPQPGALPKATPSSRLSLSLALEKVPPSTQNLKTR